MAEAIGKGAGQNGSGVPSNLSAYGSNVCFGPEAAIGCGPAASREQEAVIAVLRIESVIHPALKAVGGMKPRTSADENAAVEANPLPALPNYWPSSATAAGKAATR
jgi:hypothetical protein